MTHKGTVVAMYSHVTREACREATILEFARVGCPVAHVQLQSAAPRPREQRRNAWQALRAAALTLAPSVGARGVLLVEDDVAPADTLPEWLAYLEATQTRAVTLYAHSDRWYPLRLRRVARGERAATRSEVATVADLGTWWGSQAVWLPIALAREFAVEPRLEAHEHGLGPWDSALKAFVIERGDTLGVAVPNVVQHLAPPNLVNAGRPPHASACFVRDASAPA